MILVSTETHPGPAPRGRLGGAGLTALCACLLSLPAWCGQSGVHPARADSRDLAHDSRPHLLITANAASSSHAFPWLVVAAADPKTLDLKGLEKRLVNTKAIGLLSKLSLKGKLDGFVKDLRAAHGGGGEHTVEEMRERYDLLVHNVQIMLEKKDPELAKEIAAAREPMWKLLAEVESFEKTVGGTA